MLYFVGCFACRNLIACQAWAGRGGSAPFPGAGGGGGPIIQHGFDVGFGQAEYLAQFADHGGVLEGAVGGEQGRVFAAVAFENIIGDVVAFVPGEVDVEIGRRSALWIDESFEIQVEFERLHVGDVQAVGHDGVGAAAAPDVVITGGFCVSHDVPGDEEIGGEVHFGDHFQFLVHALLCARGGVAHSGAGSRFRRVW